MRANLHVFVNVPMLQGLGKTLIMILVTMWIRCLVTSRLDYCNFLLYGITKAHLKRLTGIQYRAAKLVSRC